MRGAGGTERELEPSSVVRVRPLIALLVAVNLFAGAGAWRADAQLPTLPGQDPTTSTAPPSSDTTAPPVSDPPTGPDTTAVPGAGAEPEEGGDGGGTGTGGQSVPSEARRYIDSIRRSAPSDDEQLVRAQQALMEAGLTEFDAIQYAYGRFPVAGYARWSDDWLMPRWTGSMFRYHLGCDVLAAYGTPLRAVVDGVVQFGSSELGGLSVKVVEPDGTFYYYAHLAALPEGLVDGQDVTTGAIVGFVGDSGNARGGPPHVHFAIHPRGGDPVPPKPYLDQWVADAAAQLPELLAFAEGSRPRGLVATGLVRRLAADSAVGDPLPAAPSRTDLLFASSASPLGGALAMADALADTAARSVDWEAMAIEQQAFALAWEQEADRARGVLDPLVPETLRTAVDARIASTRTPARP